MSYILIFCGTISVAIFVLQYFRVQVETSGEELVYWLYLRPCWLLYKYDSRVVGIYKSTVSNSILSNFLGKPTTILSSTLHGHKKYWEEGPTTAVVKPKLKLKV